MDSGQRIGGMRGLGANLALTNFVCVMGILVVLLGCVAWGVQSAMHTRVEEEMSHSVDLVRRMVESTDKDLRQRTGTA